MTINVAFQLPDAVDFAADECMPNHQRGRKNSGQPRCDNMSLLLFGEGRYDVAASNALWERGVAITLRFGKECTPTGNGPSAHSRKSN